MKIATDVSELSDGFWICAHDLGHALFLIVGEGTMGRCLDCMGWQNGEPMQVFPLQELKLSFPMVRVYLDFSGYPASEEKVKYVGGIYRTGAMTTLCYTDNNGDDQGWYIEALVGQRSIRGWDVSVEEGYVILFDFHEIADHLHSQIDWSGPTPQLVSGPGTPDHGAQEMTTMKKKKKLLSVFSKGQPSWSE